MNDLFNNPLVFMMNAMRRGGSPQTLLQQLAQQDPRAQQVLQILGNKPSRQQREIVQNMARERGVDLDNLARSLGIQIPSNR